MAFGLLTTGFAPMSLQDIRAAINASFQAAFGPSIDVSDGSILGQIAGIMAEQFSQGWELAEAINSSMDPDSATGAALDALCALTGTVRRAATASTVTLTLIGTNGTSVTAGSQASVTVTGAKFATDTTEVIATATSWAILFAYAIGDTVKNAGNLYRCIEAGTSAGAGGPTTTSSDITDGTVHWKYIAAGSAFVDVGSTCIVTGPTVALADSIVTIETPVSGWASVRNLLDADLGRNIETDEDLRIRREAELAAPGTSTVNAIIADLLEVPGVTAVGLFVNNSDVTDVDGLTPHSIEALVSILDTPENNQLVFDALLDTVAAGINTNGSTVGSATDSAGNVHTMKFSHPEELLVYADLVIKADFALYPANGDDQVKEAIVAYGDAQRAGKDIVSTAILAQAFSVPGVLEVTSCFIDIAPGPTLSVTIPVTLRQIAVYDTSRISVSSSFVTP